ncbi:MAG: uroporphyrinogen decarboxylase family protein [Rectinemataceae bacterium]|nr:hypothetical protein [Spirochaetaceae bacterium]
MTKRQRLETAISGGTPDRVPVSIYQHSTVHQRGAREFAEWTLAFHKMYDPDYVKVMYDELYDTPVNYQFATGPEVWELLEPLDPHRAAFGRCLESLKIVRDHVPEDTPVIATVFSPLHIALRLAWNRLGEDLRSHPEQLRRGLRTIADNLVVFIQVAREEAGIDGFFLGAFGAEPAWLSREEYETFEQPLDLMLLEAMRSMPFVIVHAHGEKDSYTDLFAQYPCHALSWEDRLAGPSLAEMRRRTEKCLVGGVDHVVAQRAASPEVIYAQACEAITVTGGRGFILAPGCTFLENTPPENMHALRRAAMDMAEKGPII